MLSLAGGRTPVCASLSPQSVSQSLKSTESDSNDRKRERESEKSSIQGCFFFGVRVPLENNNNSHPATETHNLGED